MKWLKILGVAIVLILPAVSMEAGTSTDVTVTATPMTLSPPIEFTLTVIDSNEIKIDWVKGYLAENTEIRGKQGSYPIDRTDGYQVYYGNGITTSDTTVALDDLAVNMYYRAWSEDVSSNWTTNYAEANIGGAGMTFIGTIALAGMLTFFCWRRRNIALTLGACLAWLSMAFWFLIGDGAPFSVDDSWGLILGGVFIIMAFIPALTYMDNPVVRNAGGRSWTEYKNDKELRQYEERQPTPYEKGRADLRRKLQAQRRGRW